MILITVRSSLYFTFDNIDSRDMGIINASIDSGWLQEPFLPSREILYIESRNVEKPYFQNIRYQPLQFDLVLAFEYGFDEGGLREVRQWLGGDKFKELRFSDQAGRVYMAMCQDVSVLSHAVTQGYVSITFVTSSPYAMSDVVEKGMKSMTTITSLVDFTRDSIAIHPETKSVLAKDSPIILPLDDGEDGLLLESETENLISVDNAEIFSGEETIYLDSGTYTVSNQGVEGDIKLLAPVDEYFLSFVFPIKMNKHYEVSSGEHEVFTIKSNENVTIKEVI